MARALNKLSARAVTTIGKPGRHSDGGGLYLIVDPSGARRWLFLFRWGGKLKELGLGGVGGVPLAAAREKATKAREMVKSGVNPIEARAAAKTAAASAKTFGDVADQVVAQLKPGFKNVKHQAQWTSTLQTYAASLRPIAIAEVTTDQILEVLQPIWLSKSETASRVRGRIERILDAARARGLRSGDNPARWRGHLDHLLPKRANGSPKHHAAMPYEAVPAFMTRLRQREAVAAMALEVTILCAARTEELLQARWTEIDKAGKVWIIPPERMKVPREHRVPLCARALEIIERAEALRDGKFIFPGQRRGQPLSNMAMSMLMRRLGAEAFTVHGFRSSFRDWAGECTSFPREVAEAALAHQVGDETERAYRRGDALAKRRKLMDAWARFLDAPEIKQRAFSLQPARLA